MHQDVNYDHLLNELGTQGSLAKEMGASLLHGYVDQDGVQPIGDFGPKLLTNQFDNQIWDQLRSELNDATEYAFAVAFVTDAMVSNLKPLFRTLAARGVKGRLLTSTYLQFNQPDMFEELLKIDNLEVRIATVKGFHQKGYLFKHRDYQTVIIGSANLTASALMKNQNYEWSLKVSSLNNGEITRQIEENFEAEWRDAKPLSEDWLDGYRKAYQADHQVNRAVHDYVTPSDEPGKAQQVKPNQMQTAALNEIEALRLAGKDRGLVVSATGTGKTYLGAFDVRAAKPKRMLFLAHREQILQKSCQSFKNILGGDPANFGLYTGGARDKNAKYLFASVQTLSREEHLHRFSPDDFDYILIDEVHHAGAESYQRIMDYFTPKFFLGMTATPERSDDFNIFNLFHYNVAYEIRLQQALELNMLAPFHYVGLTDYAFADQYEEEVDQYRNRKQGSKPSRKQEQRAVELLTIKERVNYILEQTDYYGYSGPGLHGLVFCSSVAEAEALARAFTAAGHPAKALSGADNGDRRRQVVHELENGLIEYIITVDIFNEGIDIPCVNQVVFLRNTQSAIVYVQQLGRGLRKYPGKEYVEVLDFIGNYKNNYMIPIALTGDNSYSKDQARDTVDIEPTVGLSTIAFDEVAKERIYESLSKVKLDGLANLRDAYQNIKRRVGRIPMLSDFLKMDSVDPQILATVVKPRNYNRFLLKMGEPVEVTDYEDQALSLISVELLNGKRRHELILLRLLLQRSVVKEADYVRELKEAGCYVNEATLNSVRRVLSLQYYAERAYPSRASYGGVALVNYDPDQKNYQMGEQLAQALTKRGWFYQLWSDTIETGLLRAERYQANEQFTIGERYTRRDAVRLINNPYDMNGQLVSGYRFTSEETGLKEAIIFVTYKKAKNIRKEINYNNRFINDHVLHYYTKNSDIKLDSANVVKFMGGEYKLRLFVQKSGAIDETEFYYLGTCRYLNNSVQKETQDGVPRLAMDLLLDHPVEHNRYHTFID